jgi:[ribosomal protein S5]-alanine N-acetyltransferase
VTRPNRVVVGLVGARDLPELVQLAKASRRLHRPWVHLPESGVGWQRYLARCQDGSVIGYLIRLRDSRELVGVANLSELVRGSFQSAYLGFYAHAAYAGEGLMSEGLRIVLSRAFGIHRLHRVEANVQPRNGASLRLVRRLGFRREGFSPSYLRIGGRWRDHERWAVTRELWRAHRSGVRRRRTKR